MSLKHPNPSIDKFNKLINELEQIIRTKSKTPENYQENMQVLQEARQIAYESKDEKERKKLYKALINLRKKLTFLSFSEKVELFMKYINSNDIPSQTSNIRFCDLNTNIFNNTLVGKWFLSQIYNNSTKFRNEFEKYCDIYPQAYQKIIDRINKIPTSKKVTDLFKRKILIFLEAIEKNLLDLPIKNAELTFDDFDTNIKSNSKVKDWLHNVLIKEKDVFLKICFEYKETYPQAYQKIINYINSIKNKGLDTETRVKLWLSYVNKYGVPRYIENITFKNIDPTCHDTANVLDYIRYQIIYNLEEFCKYLEKYKEQYPIGYTKTLERLKNYLKTKSKYYLSMQEKEELTMQYINEHELPTLKDNILFSTICPSSLCESTIYHWLMRNVLISKERTYDIINRYKDIYPNACSRLYNRIEELEQFRKTRPLIGTFEQRVIVFMQYTEDNDILSDLSDVRFIELNPSFQDTTLVGNWFRDQLSRNLEKFYQEIIKYKDRYPFAYHKIMDRMNLSKTRAKKLERIKKETKTTN